MNAILSGTKRRTSRSVPIAPWLDRLERAIRPLERLRLSQLRPAAVDNDELGADGGWDRLGRTPPELDSFTSTGQARLAVDCTLSGDRCNEPSRYFVQMGLAQSPVHRVATAIREFVSRKLALGRARD